MEGEIRASRRKEIIFTEPQLQASSPQQDALLLLNPQGFTDFHIFRQQNLSEFLRKGSNRTKSPHPCFLASFYLVTKEQLSFVH